MSSNPISSTTGTISDWTSYVPAFQGFGTPTNVSFFYRRVDDTIELRGYFTTGTVTGAEARVYLPTGVTSADSTKIPTPLTNNGVAGGFVYTAEVSSTFFGYSILIQPSVTYINFGFQSSGTADIVIQLANSIFATGIDITLEASFPIQEWY